MTLSRLGRGQEEGRKAGLLALHTVELEERITDGIAAFVDPLEKASWPTPQMRSS